MGLLERVVFATSALVVFFFQGQAPSASDRIESMGMFYDTARALNLVMLGLLLICCAKTRESCLRVISDFHGFEIV